jgi:IPT/TIG domain-containing protein
MRRITITFLTLIAAALLVVPATAGAAQKRSPAPQITRVQPMRVAVGGTLTVTGRNFKAQRGKNTLIFRASNGRTAFAKPARATKTKLVVRVPAAVGRLLRVANSSQRPTRLQLRVLAGKFSKFTPRRLSPVVTGVGDGTGGPGGPGGAAVCPGPDYDGDLLSNASELDLKLDPCLADTDGDSVEDGYEYQSALDLNHYPRTAPLPYPGKRPYPNPLDPGDGVAGGTDYDGDGLKLREEFAMWLRYSADGVLRASRPGSLSGLVYSDGLQSSIDSPPLPAPAPGTLAAWAMDINGDGVLRDDERDADADGLGNWDELRGRMTEDWWPAQHNGTAEPKESKYPDLDFLDNEDTAPAFDAHIDSDMDGDGVLDGADDNDHDGLSNQFEVNRPGDWMVDTGFNTDPFTTPAPNPWAYTNPFNPCKPFNSERCHAHPPFDYYKSDEVPPIGPNPPAGYPSVTPVTPDG